MEFISITALTMAVFFLTLVIAANDRRSQQDPPFELIPNCLLTRKPILFLTGPRSIFYFKSYWNIYPSYLAEHGYEVYTLRLPWRSRKIRRQALERALQSSQQNHQSYHLFLDTWALEDLKALEMHFSRTVISKNIIAPFLDSGSDSTMPSLNLINEDSHSWIQRLLYRGHCRLLMTDTLPTLAALGGTEGVQLKNARLLLERAQVLAERDLLENS